jgi:uncharacterized protein
VTAETEAVKKPRPLVPYLKLPEKEGEEAYIFGSKCKSCGAVFVGSRIACANCRSTEPMDAVRFGNEGELYVYTIVHQSGPGIEVPYVAAIVDLAEGASVRATLKGVEPKPENLSFGMKLKLVTEKVGTDREGNDVIAYKFAPVTA